MKLHQGHTFVVWLAVLLLAGGLAPSAFAQSSTQEIQGLVTDASGSVVPGARVTITNTGTGVSRTATTNETGNYTFPLVEVGNYEVRCELQGFKAETVRGLRVETAAQVRQDFALQLGQVTETVEVSAAAVLLTTENATVGGVIENKRIIELPLNGRNVVSLAVLVPGVQFGERTGRGDGLGGFPIPGQGFSVSANGQREIHQVVSLDGVDAKDPRIHITNFVPSVEALEEFKIQTNAYSSEYGFGGGAVTTMTMKSGTNSLHGTLFEFLRNDKFDAEDYFLNFQVASGATRAPKNRLRRNQFGVVVSGPLIKNKTFWAFNWESRRERVQ
ncbi:MAG: carboxypeptidase regulatory-like domain-containing protein [Acidobacteria bacterium]|nr:carboxypeptidase regulatory-like domain-containing protein [Acidobacteriota bacterium]